MTLNIQQLCAAPEPESASHIADDIKVIDGKLFRRHPYGGGLVELTAHVSPNAYIAEGAQVLGHAMVQGSARLFGQSVAEDFAVICSLVTLRDCARVGGSAVLLAGVVARGGAYIGGSSVLAGPVLVQNKVRVIDLNLRGRLTIA